MPRVGYLQGRTTECTGQGEAKAEAGQAGRARARARARDLFSGLQSTALPYRTKPHTPHAARRTPHAAHCTFNKAVFGPCPLLNWLVVVPLLLLLLLVRFSPLARLCQPIPRVRLHPPKLSRLPLLAHSY